MDALINIFTYPNPYGETTESMDAYMKNLNGYSAFTYMMMIAYAAYVFLNQNEYVQEEDTEEEISETEDEKGLEDCKTTCSIIKCESNMHLMNESDDDDNTEEDPDYIVGVVEDEDDDDDDEPDSGGQTVEITASAYIEHTSDMNVSQPINCY